MTADEIEALFTRQSGEYAFARWGRPLAPVVFGVDDKTLGVSQLAGTSVTETDPELGTNFIWFFFTDWSELLDVPNMDRLVPDLDPLVTRLIAADANQYRIFRFDEAGAIKACFVFLRMDEHLSKVPAETLALSQVVQSFLLWSDTAFRDRSALAVAGETTVLRPDVAALIRAAYDPVMPAVASDASHALRLCARIPPVI
jgi:SpoU rRNA methylase family enzyme